MKRSFLPIPLIGVGTSMLLAIILSLFDVEEHLQYRPPDEKWSVLVFTGDAVGARALINMLAGAVISILTLTFSLTVLALQMAAFNYSPRIIDEFMKDKITKATLSVYLGTFTYCFTLSFIIKDGTDTEPEYVPVIAVNVTIMYMIAVVIVFVAYLHFFLTNMRIERILNLSKDAALDIIVKSYPIISHNDIACDDNLPAIPEKAIRVKAVRSGYITKWEIENLLNLCEEHNMILRYYYPIGHYVTKGTYICWCWSKSGEYDNLYTHLDRQSDDGTIIEYLSKNINNGLLINNMRTGDFDVSLGIRQLVDIATRALSPGVNDPQTAIQVIDALSDIFSELCHRKLQNYRVYDSSGDLRICSPSISFGALLSMCIIPIRSYGITDIIVVRRAIYFLADIGSLSTNVRDTERISIIKIHIKQWLDAVKQKYGDHSLEYKQIKDVVDHAKNSMNLGDIVADVQQSSDISVSEQPAEFNETLI